MKTSSSKTRWSPEEDAFLTRTYRDGDLSEIAIHLNRSLPSIKLRARRLDLFRSFVSRRQSDLSVFLDSDPISLYWIGFLLADGHFSNTGRIICHLSLKDEGHLKKLADFVKSPNIHNYATKVSFSVQDKDIVPILMEKFQIKSNKTYDPPNLSSLTEEELWPILIGLFDGDGSIWRRKSGGIQGMLKCHSSWLSVIEKLRAILPTQGSVIRINNLGYAQWTLSATQLGEMNQIAKEKELPVLTRKWSLC